MLFDPEANSILLSREYFLEYRCKFDLTFYPFDTQVRSAGKIGTISLQKIICFNISTYN